MPTIVASAIRENDVLQFATNGDFQRRNSRTTYGVVREIVRDVNDASTISRFVVFEIIPDDEKIRSGTRTAPILPDHAMSYGLSPKQKWAVIVDPVALDVDENHYYVNRTGHLKAEDASAIAEKILEMGGIDPVNMGGTGPTGFSTTNWDKIVSPGYERRLHDKVKEEQDPNEIVKRRRRRSGLPNEGFTVDLPLDFAGKITDLDARLIAALKAQNVRTLREARDLTSDRERMTKLVEPPKANELPALSIDEAIAAGYLPEDTRGLGLVTVPIGKTKPIKTLNALFASAQNNGEGFNNYVGLASKTAKTRQTLIDAAHDAWEKYRGAAAVTGESADTLTAQIKKAWSDVMTDYMQFVRPHVDIASSTMTEPDKIPDQYKQDGKLIFIFPRLEM